MSETRQPRSTTSNDPCGPVYFQTTNDITRIFDNVQGVMPGVTTDMAALVIWNTIEDFFTRSAYKREHVYWELQPGEIEIQFDPYDPQRQWRVCWFLGFTGLQNPKFVPPGLVIDLTNPTPQNVRSGEALLALKPDNIQVELPYDVLTKYWEAIVSGVLHRLYMQPGKPYSDLNASQIHGRLYRSGVASARGDAQSWHLRDQASWQFPYFATGGHPTGRRGGSFSVR